MSHLPMHIIESRREILYESILNFWEINEKKDTYYIQCPWLRNCNHFSAEEIPRIILPFCYYPGELDYYIVTQPFLPSHNFRVTWICVLENCDNELACGFPPTSSFNELV